MVRTSKKNPKGSGEKKHHESIQLPMPGTKYPMMPIIPHPFNLKPFNEQIFNKRLRAGETRAENERIASKILAKSPQRQVMYLVLLFQIGAEIQRVWRRVESDERVLNLDQIRNYISLGSHGIFKNLDRQGTIPKGDKVLNVDTEIIMWINILKDCHLLLQAHVEDFVSTCHLSLAPSYSSKSPNQE